MIEQPASSKVMKQKATATATATPKAFWGSGERDGVWVARWSACPAICICPLREHLTAPS